MRLLKLSALLLLLMPGLFPRDGICAGSASQNDEPSYSSDQNAPQHKRETLRGVALSWIDIGTELVKRGLYEQAEQS
ncbi:MAG: hypothetical protein ABSB91_04350, partial [Sedimentisphaerales bacterium]